MNDIQLFMCLYMYGLEVFLNENKTEFHNIELNKDEANLDSPLKTKIKELIEESYRTYQVNDEIKNISVIKIDGQKHEISDDIKKARIEKVILPGDIKDELKNILKSKKNGVYTNPDLCLKIEIAGRTEYVTIELKATKRDAILGSSVKQIDFDEWTVFFKRTKTLIKFTTGRYINAINSKVRFPDRNPRPEVAFSEVESWNNDHRKIEDNTLSLSSCPENEQKKKIINDLDNVLADRWVKILFGEEKQRGRTPWFTCELRRFIIKFLDKYDKLPNNGKEDLKKNIRSKIK